MNNSILAKTAALFVVLGITQEVVAASEYESMVLEEIVVTATKRTESKQDVPIAVSVIGAEEIANSGSTDLMALASLVPNFVFDMGNNTATSDISVRGIYQQVAAGSVGYESGVSVYVDGVYMGKQFTANTNLGQTERVEVLRGPQGTLFGKNTISGAVNIVTKSPDNEVEGSMSIDIGNRNLSDFKGHINLPIIEDRLALRLSMGVRRQDGFVDNTLLGETDFTGDTDNTSARLQVRFTPGERTTIDLNSDIYKAELNDYVFEVIADSPVNDNIKFTQTNNHPNTTETDQFGISLSIEHELGNGYTLNSISGWRDDEMVFQADIDGAAGDLFNGIFGLEPEQFTQELRISSPTDQSFDFVAGLYYFEQETLQFDVFLPGPQLFGPAAGRIDKGQIVDVESIAAFFHANFHINENLTLFAGLRYTDEGKELTTLPAVCVVNPITCIALRMPTFTSPQPAPVDVSTQEPSWTLGIRRFIDDDMMVYASVSRGIKSGAFNKEDDAVAAYARGTLVADPEFVTSYEVGAKTSWMDRRLELNAAAFYMDYEDMQVRTTDQSAAVPITKLSNAAAATSKGMELELKAFATENVVITAGLGFVNATFEKYEGVTDNKTRMLVDASGNNIPLAPELTFNVAIQHTVELAGGMLLSRLDYSFIDERYSVGGVVNTDDFLLDSRSLVNARVSYRSPSDTWGIAGWARNLTDDQSLTYKAWRAAFGTRGVAAMYQQPRTYGVTLDLRF